MRRARARPAQPRAAAVRRVAMAAQRRSKRSRRARRRAKNPRASVVATRDNVYLHRVEVCACV